MYQLKTSCFSSHPIQTLIPPSFKKYEAVCWFTQKVERMLTAFWFAENLLGKNLIHPACDIMFIAGNGEKPMSYLQWSENTLFRKPNFQWKCKATSPPTWLDKNDCMEVTSRITGTRKVALTWISLNENLTAFLLWTKIFSLFVHRPFSKTSDLCW